MSIANPPMPDIGGVFREPFDEQAAFFRLKLGNLVPTERWTDMQKEAHDTGFMVAGAQSASLLSDLAAAVDRAIVHGDSLDMFRKNFKSIASEHGWAYKGEFNWRTRTIYQTNMSTSYNAGRLAQLVEGAFAYWVYVHSKLTQHPRKEHQAWDGTTLPPGHDWWKSHFTPNGWGCLCHIKGVNRLPDNAKTDPPPSPIDPDTGTPKGIDKGWDYMPGATVADKVRVLTRQTTHWPDVLTKKFFDSMPASSQDAFARSYRKLPSTADEARRFAKAYYEGRKVSKEFAYLGRVESKDVAPLKTMTIHDKPNMPKPRTVQGLDVEGYEFVLDESGVNHVRGHHGNDAKERKQGQRGVVDDDFAKIPEVLNDPDSIEPAEFSVNGKPLVRYSKEIDGETYSVVLEYRSKKKRLAVQTMYIKV